MKSNKTVRSAAKVNKLEKKEEQKGGAEGWGAYQSSRTSLWKPLFNHADFGAKQYTSPPWSKAH